MKVVRYELIPERELLRLLKQTRLRGHGQPCIYAGASLELVPQVDPDTLVPAQRYVLEEDFWRIEALYRELMSHSVDIFALEGGLLFWAEEPETGQIEGPIPLIPPVVEESREEGGEVVALINDGMHRVYAAKRLGRHINVVLARNVPPEFPYYAKPLEDGWSGVEELSALPDNYLKKTYRDPENYKALFRDFNEHFPGIQKQRKRSNPEHLRG
jgi:hypothetical protein